MRRVVVVALGGLTAAALLSVAATGSTATCSFDPGTRTVFTNVGGGTNFAASLHVRSFDRMIAIDDADLPDVPLCASADDTDTVAIAGSTSAHADDVFYIDNRSNSPFRPGFTDEPGSSDEIEFSVDFSAGGGNLGITNSIVGVGAPVAIETRLGGDAINLNAGESDGIDADVKVQGVDRVFVGGDARADEIAANGGAGTGGADFRYTVLLEGHEGADRLVGGRKDDRLTGSEGGDRLSGGDGDDVGLGGEDGDVVAGGGGRDELFGEDGADVLRGGPGRDHCVGGPGRDVYRGCELRREA